MNAPAPTYASHFGVYAFIVDPALRQLLLIKKSLGCYTGLYDLPGGTMEPHETLEETLLRETLEETSCRITSYQPLGNFTVLYPLPDSMILRHIGILYLADIEGTPCEGPAGGDSDGCIWIGIDDLHAGNAAPLVLQGLESWRGRAK